MFRNRSLLAVSFVALMSFMGIGMIIPVRVLYAEQQGASFAVIGAMATVFLVSNFIFQYPIGWIADRWGRKRTMLAGLVWQALFTALYIFVTDPVLFVVLRFFEGIASAAILPSARALIADTVPADKQGEAYGIFGAFFNAGFAIGPGIGSLLAALNYEAAFIGSVVARLAAIVVVLLVIQETVRKKTDAAEIKARLPLGALFTLPLVAVYILVFADYLYLGFDQTIFPLWMRDHLGADVLQIGLVYVAFSIPNMILSPIGGKWADRVPRSRLILLFGLAQVPLFMIYGFLQTALPVIILQIVHGAIFAFIQPAVDAHLASSSRADARARTQGLYSSFGLVGAFVGANALTALYTVDYRFPLFALGLTYAVGVLIGGTLVRISEQREMVPMPYAEEQETQAAALNSN